MLKPLRKIILATLGILPMLVPIDDARAADATDSSTPDYLTSASELPWRKARLSLEMQTGTRSIGTLDALIPFMGNDDFIVYADLMAKGATDNAFEGNLGLGVRRVNDAETAIWGAYAFYDVLKSVNNNQFTQVTVGMERLGLTWDFRANAYVPIGKTKYVNTIYAGGSTQIVNHNIIEYVQTQEEHASTGGDLEIGRTLGTNKVRGYIAAYTFGENLTGPRARVEYQMNSHVALNAAVQYDQARQAQYFVGARFTVGGAKTSNSDSIYSRLTDTVVRDVDVVTNASLTDNTQMAMDKFWMVDQSTTGTDGTGTLENPFANISDAIAAAPEGAIIYVKGVDGKVYDAGIGSQLKQGQMLVGSGHDLHFDFERNVAYFSANDNSLFLMGGNGIQPTISGTLLANSNVGIYNLNLMANELARDQAGIMINDSQNVIIKDVSISGFNAENGRGILVSGNSQVSVTNLSVKDNYIGVDVDSSTLNVKDALTIDQSQFAGLHTNNASVTASSIQITNSNQYGIFSTGGQVTALGNLSVNGGTQGILAEAGSLIKADTATITNSDVHVNGATLNVTHDLNISANQIMIENGGVVQSDTANITAGHMIVNQASWSNNNGLVTINGADGVGLWLQNKAQVKLGKTNISNAADSLKVDGESTLNLIDTLTTDHTVTVNDATINAINANFVQNDLIMNGGAFNASQLLTVKNIAMNTGSVNSKDITVSGDVSVNAGSLVSTNAFTVNADATHKISVSNGGALTTNIAAVSTGTLLLDNATWNNTSGVVTLAQDITVENGAEANISSATVTTKGSINVDGETSLLSSSGSINAKQLSVTNDGKIIADDKASTIAANKVILDKGMLDISNGSLTVTGSDADGVTVKNASTLLVNELKVNNNAGNGIVVTSGTVNANTITATGNVSSGIVMEAGNMTVAGEVDANENGREESKDYRSSIGHGLEMNGGTVDFNVFKGMSNIGGDGIHQSAGAIVIQTATLNGNVSGFNKTSGTATIFDATVSGNTGNGLNIDSVDAKDVMGFTAHKIKISGNADKGILLAQGSVTLENLNIDNQIKVSGDATEDRTLIINNDSNSDDHIAVTDVSKAKTDKERAAILVESDSNVTVKNAVISGSTGGYGVYVDANGVTLSNVVIQGSKSGVVLTNGTLDITNGSAIQGNDENGVVLTNGTLNINGSFIQNNKENGILVTSASNSTNDKRVLNLWETSINGNTEAGMNIAAAANVTCESGACEISHSNVGINVGVDNFLIKGFVLHDNTTAGINVTNTVKTLNLENITIDGNATSIGVLQSYESGNFNLICQGDCKVNNSVVGISSASQEITVNGMLLSNNATGILSANTERNKTTLKDTTIIGNNKMGVGIEGKSANNYLICESGCTLNDLDTAVLFSGPSSTLQDFTISDNKTGVTFLGNGKLNINGTTLSSNITGVALKNTTNTTVLTFSNSRIDGGDYGISILDSAGVVNVTNAIINSTMTAGIFAEISNNLALTLTNNDIGNSENGVLANFKRKAALQLDMTGSHVNGNANGIFISENGEYYSKDSKIYIHENTFAKNDTAINNHSFADIYARNVGISNSNSKTARGIVSSGSQSDDITAGGQIFLDNVNIQDTKVAVISSKNLVISNTSFGNAMLNVKGSLIAGDNNRVYGDGVIKFRNNDHGYIDDGNFVATPGLVLDDIGSRLAFTGNPLS